MTKQLTRTIKE